MLLAKTRFSGDMSIMASFLKKIKFKLGYHNSYLSTHDGIDPPIGSTLELLETSSNARVIAEVRNALSNDRLMMPKSKGGHLFGPNAQREHIGEVNEEKANAVPVNAQLQSQRKALAALEPGLEKERVALKSLEKLDEIFELNLAWLAFTFPQGNITKLKTREHILFAYNELLKIENRILSIIDREKFSEALKIQLNRLSTEILNIKSTLSEHYQTVTENKIPDTMESLLQYPKDPQIQDQMTHKAAPKEKPVNEAMKAKKNAGPDAAPLPQADNSVTASVSGEKNVAPKEPEPKPAQPPQAARTPSSLTSAGIGAIFSAASEPMLSAANKDELVSTLTIFQKHYSSYITIGLQYALHSKKRAAGGTEASAKARVAEGLLEMLTESTTKLFTEKEIKTKFTALLKTHQLPSDAFFNGTNKSVQLPKEFKTLLTSTTPAAQHK